MKCPKCPSRTIRADGLSTIAARVTATSTTDTEITILDQDPQDLDELFSPLDDDWLIAGGAQCLDCDHEDKIERFAEPNDTYRIGDIEHVMLFRYAIAHRLQPTAIDQAISGILSAALAALGRQDLTEQISATTPNERPRHQ